MPERASRGTKVSCRSWQQEGILRMLMNTLDPEVAERPDELVVYGGSGKAVRSWEAYRRIVQNLKVLGNDETLLIQSGKPVAVFPTHEMAPRVVMANTMIVPAWSTWEGFWEMERKGLTMYGQSTAGAWAYIGTQGVLQGTYETFAEVARRHFGGSLKGRFVLTAGLGAMGRAQPQAVAMNEGIALVVEADGNLLHHRLQKNYCDMATASLDEALAWVEEARGKRLPRSVGLWGNAADVYPELVKRGILPDVVTDQTSAHDPLNGYLPSGLSLEEALTLRKEHPDEYIRRARRSMAIQVQAMLDLKRHGAVVFDYGNNIREQAAREGVGDSFSIPGFVQEYIRPLLCEGRGPFRWIALSGDPDDIYRIDTMVLREFGSGQRLSRWLRFAEERLWFQGLPARVCWLDFQERVRFGELLSDLIAQGQLAAPIAITRDHLDAGAMASPNRETEGMPDGSDAIADWPILNALLNSSAGATMVSVHQGGGVGIGYSIHAGMTIIVDGQETNRGRLQRVLTADAGIGLIRHADAGYTKAAEVATANGLRMI